MLEVFIDQVSHEKVAASRHAFRDANTGKIVEPESLVGMRLVTWAFDTMGRVIMTFEPIEQEKEEIKSTEREDIFLDKREFIKWIDDLKIKSDNPSEGQLWYDTALQDVLDAIARGRFDKE